MSDDPAAEVRALFARLGIAASEPEIQRAAAMASLRRPIEPALENEPQLVQHVLPWKPR